MGDKKREKRAKLKGVVPVFEVCKGFVVIGRRGV